MHRKLNWLLMLATLATAVALYAIKYDTRRLETRVQAQERALEKAESDVTILAAERAYLARPERLEPLARLNGLGPIASKQYLRIDVDGASSSGPRGEPVEPRSGHARPVLRQAQDEVGAGVQVPSRREAQSPNDAAR
jgi:cell division protein FtsL